MFYSHEILTSRKYGVATVWLVATLGPKSSTRRVTKKAILDVNLKKACETIIEPKAPMALRLLSNLLYGVTRVYTQKWDYLLSDTQAIQSSMRTFFTANQSNQIDRNAGKSRPEQLILADDPAFLVDGPLEPPPLNLEEMVRRKPPCSSQTRPSTPFLRFGSSEISAHNDSSIGLEILSSSQVMPRSHEMNDYDPIRGSSIAKKAGFDRADDEELTLIQNDDLFEIDDYGEIHELPLNRPTQSPLGSLHQEARSLDTSETSGLNFIEHPEEVKGLEAAAAHYPQKFSDPIPTPPLEAASPVYARENSKLELPARATQKHKKKTNKKNLTVADRSTELGSIEISTMMANYSGNMKSQSSLKSRAKAQAYSKKNAIYYLFGTGINFVGETTASSMVHNPLSEFSGAALTTRIIGKHSVPSSTAKKRPASKDKEETHFNKRIRSREPEPDIESANIIFEDENLSIQANQNFRTGRSDNSVEIGRKVESAMKDSSAVLPWNQSTSVFSHQKSSIRGPGSRLVSASPLLAYGTGISGDKNMIDEMIPYEGLDYTYNFPIDAGESNLHTEAMVQPVANDDFELFGPAAGVDTQTAGTSQWVRETMHRESENFIGFVRNTIGEKMAITGDPTRIDRVTFLELFDPQKNSRIVAAQAFYHVLCLATKHQLLVDQISAKEDGSSQLDDSIFIGLY